MKKLVIWTAVLILGFKFGLDYLLSAEFQKYADQKKSPWTCTANNVIANVYISCSSYDKAYDLFARVPERCPESPMMEEAMFKMAQCMEDMGRSRDAVPLYTKYLEKYPDTKRARLAQRNAQNILSGS